MHVERVPCSDVRDSEGPDPLAPDDAPFDQDAPDPLSVSAAFGRRWPRPYTGRHRAPPGTPRDPGLRRGTRRAASPPGAPLPRQAGFWDHRRFLHAGGVESVAIEAQPAVQAWLPRVPVWLAVAALLGAFAALAGSWTPTGWLASAGFVALFAWVGVHLARWRLEWYVVTTKRVMRVEGVWRRRAFTVPLDRVTDVSYEQTWFEDKLGIGTVKVLSANEDSLLREMRHVPHPDEFFRILWDLVNRSKMLLGTPPAPGFAPAGHTSVQSGWDGTPLPSSPRVPQPWDETTPQVAVTRGTLQF